MDNKNFVAKKAGDAYAKKVIGITNRHFKKYGHRKMSLKELDKLCENV